MVAVECFEFVKTARTKRTVFGFSIECDLPFVELDTIKRSSASKANKMILDLSRYDLCYIMIELIHGFNG